MAEPPSHFSDEAAIKPQFMKLAYQYLVNNFLVFFLMPIMAVALSIVALRSGPHQIIHLCNSMHFTSIHILCSSFLIIYAFTFFFMSRPCPVYLVDYALFKPPRSFQMPLSRFMEHTRLFLASEPKSLDFVMKVLRRSGLGEETCLPPALHCFPPAPTMAMAREEAELVMFSTMDSLFEKTGLKPEDVGVLILNCSLYNPTPSLTSMVINKYKMRSNIRSFNLSGMDCSASLISIDLAKDLLQRYPNSNAVVISTEILTAYCYLGKDRTMLLPNCLFRMGGAAIHLSNRRADRRRAKYRLGHVVRTHKGGDDKSYRCISQEEDSEGRVGIKLNMDLIAVAGEAMKSNITAIAPLVLPTSEKILFALSLIGRKYVFQQEVEALYPGLQAGVRALVHPRRRAGGDRRAAEEPPPLQRASGSVEDDAA